MASRIRYVFIAAVVSLVLLEIAVRVLGLAPPLSSQYRHYVEDPVLPYRTAPLRAFVSEEPSGEFQHEVRHNSMGFRDIEHGEQKEEGVFRVLGLGDSFTYGVGAAFEETYLARLEKMLNAGGDVALPVEIVKAGIPRYFPEPERLLLEHYGLQLDPDLILVGFLPNDLIDTYVGIDAVRVDDSGYLRSLEAAGLGSLAASAYIRSHIARIVLNAYTERKARQRNRVNWPDFFEDNGPYEQTWKKIEAEYGRMVELARAKDVRIAFVHIPLAPRYSKEITPERLAYAAHRLEAWCASVGADFIDTAPALHAAGIEDLYWKHDSHCNPKGYGVIAEVLHEALLRKGLVPLGT